MRKPCQYPFTLETGVAVKTKGSDFQFLVGNRTLHNLFLCVIISRFASVYDERHMFEHGSLPADNNEYYVGRNHNDINLEQV